MNQDIHKLREHYRRQLTTVAPERDRPKFKRAGSPLRIFLFGTILLCLITFWPF